MQMPTPVTRDIVLIGGGHTHALVLRMWAMDPVPGVRLTLVNPDPFAAYSGMLPGFVSGLYARADLEIDLVRLARLAGARLVLDRATGIDRERRRIHLSGRGPLAYDFASIDIGVTSDMPGLPGFDRHGLPAKPLAAFADRWDCFLAGIGPGASPSVAVIGGGLAGTELAAAVRHRLGDGGAVHLVEADRAVAAAGAPARRALLRALATAGVTLWQGQPVTAIEPGRVRLQGGAAIPADLVIGAAAAAAQGWLTETGLALEGGFVRVGPTLQSETDDRILAAGDIAHLVHAPRPKAGVFAVRAAPTLLHNLRALATGEGALKRFRPQGDYLKLVSVGGRHAVADKWGLALSGAAMWRWKDRIDRRFMARFHDLPEMAMPAPPPPPPDPGLASQPLCGGCGAKAGRPALVRALERLPPASRPDVVEGAGDDAAVLRAGAGFQVLTTDHLRSLTADFGLMARIAAVHALGDVWSMGARPQVALAQVTLPVMAERQQAETLREILDAALAVFAPEGAEIVGGHTSLGAEMTIGFTVTGLCDHQPVTQAGARAGDVLVLTKALGTGVIMAAHMQGLADGRTVARAWAQMARPQGDTARLLAPRAHAMTDVTGFGLAGHLSAILERSGVAATLDLAALPLLPGAVALAAAGVASSLRDANRQAAGSVFHTPGPEAELLFDPQTAGGLLAAVPADVAADLCERLREAGEPAAIIGRCHAGAPGIAVEG